jgi:hypothetical protein
MKRTVDRGWKVEARRVAHGIRRRVLELTLDRTEGCYLSQALSSAEMLAMHGVGKRLYRLGLQDTYAHGAGQRYLMSEYGIGARALLKKIETVLGEDFGISDEELSGVPLSDYRSDTQLEEL